MEWNSKISPQKNTKGTKELSKKTSSHLIKTKQLPIQKKAILTRCLAKSGNNTQLRFINKNTVCINSCSKGII